MKCAYLAFYFKIKSKIDSELKKTILFSLGFIDLQILRMKKV